MSDLARGGEGGTVGGRAASPPDLARLDGYPFEARHSEAARAEAERLADLTAAAYGYFGAIFAGVSPSIMARFLTPADWPDGYGMPAYDPIDKSLRVATDDNPFWRSFARISRIASPFGAYPRLRRTYADDDGTLQLRKFFDLLVVHELAHAFDHEADATFPALWLSEFFANLALHTFVATQLPSELDNLTTFTDAQRRIGVFNLLMRLRGYRSLEDFERHFPVGTERPMSGANYGWYQIRLGVLAREVFDADGEAALRRLWAFGQADDPGRVSPWMHYLEHRSLSDWPGRMSRHELAARLESEVSWRLGQAIACWH